MTFNLLPLNTLSRTIAAAGLLLLAGCASTGPYKINLMPAPDVYDSKDVNPFTDVNPIEKIPYQGILYATDRTPADEEKPKNHYKNERGYVLRLGVGKIEIGKEGMTWEEARKVSLLKSRTENYPMLVGGIEEIGILDRTLTTFTEPGLIPADRKQAGQAFAALVNAKLKKSKKKDIYIYVHGYKVVFENPLLVATEFWHFLGYDGVAIAYAWPATPDLFAYFSDLETAQASSRNFRILLEYLAEETDAEHIHILGYSAGTRVVISALQQLAMTRSHRSKQAIQKELRIGHVILTGSDMDGNIFAGFLVDGFLKVPRYLTLYTSEKDGALGFSKWIHKRGRLGQIGENEEMSNEVIDYLRRTPELFLINVTKAEAAAEGNGHGYFRQSPWVSSDILMTLMYNLTPAQRGVVLDEKTATWVFPPDYIERLRMQLQKANPAFTP